MSSSRNLGTHLGSNPLDLAQARLLADALAGPCLVADVVPEGFRVMAADALTRRLVTGARHPAGPHHTEPLAAAGFGVLGPLMEAACRPPHSTQRSEIPVGDEPRWFEMTATPVVSGGRCRQVIVTGVDHTGEHEIERRNRRERRRLSAMLAHAPGTVLLVDTAARILHCAGAVERNTGRSPESIVGMSLFELLHPDGLARTATVFDHVLGLPGEPLRLDDLRVSHPSGTRWWDVTITNLVHDDEIAAIVLNVGDVTDRKQAIERFEATSAADPTTGLEGRRELLSRLGGPSAPGTPAPAGIVLIDLDEFGLVNEALGHETGDLVLATIAARLIDTAGDRSMVFRVGGDEFALLVEGSAAATSMDGIASAVRRCLTAPLVTPAGQVALRASIGVAHGSGDATLGDALMRAAELALARAKATGRNRTVDFSVEMQIAAEKRLAEITSLQRALHEERLRLVYQPIVRLDGALVGVEALLRWDHDGQLLSPAEFLDLAEDTGLILPIGSWVLDRACRDFHALSSAAQGLRWVSVNLSSTQLLDSRLPSLLLRAMEDAGLPPETLAVEIDERTLREHPAARKILGELSGVRAMVTFDEIGTGWNVLSSLREHGAHVLKLGRPLIAALDADASSVDRTLARAVIELARADGFEVIAQGVETRHQLDVLSELDCPLAQGHLYSPALDLATFVQFARSQQQT